jgi:hypothetical protein
MRLALNLSQATIIVSVEADLAVSFLIADMGGV